MRMGWRESIAVPLSGLLLLGCAGDTSEVPAVANILTAEEEAAGWILLFDGESMDGWEDPSQESPPGGSWTIEDGCLKAVAKPRIREDLFTTRTFGNFELMFEWRISPGGNSGVKYRIQDRAVLDSTKLNPDAERFEDLVNFELRNRRGDRSNITADARVEEYVVAFEYQVIDNAGHADARRGPQYTAGAIYDLAVPSADAARPVGEFNQSRIVLDGHHVEHWLNGVKVVDLMLDSTEVAQGLEGRWGTDSPVYELLTGQPQQQTPIGLQHHNDEVWFRNIKVRPR